jgi:uncharacterized protein with ParB-like and HNH nuclease domain/predicted transport protein
MKATSANLLNLIRGPKQFIVPIYQRTYSWHLQQCKQLWDDILEISKKTTNIGHFVGSIVYFQENIHTQTDLPKLLVIDGQQRLTTIMLLITALAEFIEGKEDQELIDTDYTRLRNYYLLNSDERNERRYKLILTKRDKETFIEVIKGINSTNNHSQSILENYNFFKNRISKENVKSVYNGILRLFIVDVALERGIDNPQLIFESLNSTGLALSKSDLIRNYVLMGQDIKTQTELYEHYWNPMEQSYGNSYNSTFDAFMRDYLSVKTGQIPKIEKVYEHFKNFVHNNTEPKVITEVVKDISKFSDYYIKMALAKEPEGDLLKIFQNILDLKINVSYPFLMSIYDDYSCGIISKEVFCEIAALVENYVFRRVLCGIPTNSLNNTFVALYKSIKKENYLESIKATFQLMEGYKRFPDNIEFEIALKTKDVYNFRSKNYLLEKLENYNRRERINLSDYSIEHIMPQNSELSEEWQKMLGEDWEKIQRTYLHTLGNITLTRYNSELSDRPFHMKRIIKGGFDHSPLHLNDSVRNVTTWNKEQIEKRAEQLAILAQQVWKAPNLTPEILAKYKMNTVESIPIQQIDDYHFLQGEVLEMYTALSKRILNLDTGIRIENRKRYIAFKLSTNFVDIVPQSKGLKLLLNMDFPDIKDPQNLCKDVTKLGVWGNGNVQVKLSSMEQLDYIMYLIQQAFDEQMGYM